MKKDIDPKLGQLIRMIQENKKLTSKEMTGGTFSESMITRVKNGENSLSVEKFFIILKNSQVFLDEFQHLYNDYEDDDEFNFQRDLVIAYGKKDIKKLQKIADLWKPKVNTTEISKFRKLNYIVSKIVLAMAQKSKPSKEDIEFLVEYLEAVDDWGRYELWIFGNCLHFFDTHFLKYYSKIILDKTKFYKSLHLNQQIVIRILLNIIDTWLCKKDLGQALKYINHTKEVGISIEFFYEKILLIYHEAHYHFLRGNKCGKEEMKKCAETIEEYGYEAEAKILFEEIESL